MDTSESVGGSGGRSSQPTTRDVRLLARALAEHWDIPVTARKAVVDRLAAVVEDPDAKLRAVLTATKTLTAMSRINLQMVTTAIQADVHENLEAQLTALEERQAVEMGGQSGF